MNRHYRTAAGPRPERGDLQRLRMDTEAMMQELDESQAVTVDNGWAVGYLDVLLLLLTLFAVLLAISYMQVGESGDEDDKAGAWLLSLSMTAADTAPLADLRPELLMAAYQARPAAPQSPAAPAPEPASQPETPVAETRVAVSGEILLAPAEADSPDPLLSFDPRELARLVVDMQDERLGVEVDEQQVRVEMQDDILFPLGSAELGEQGKSLLDKLLDGLATRDISIRVEGHTDDLPIATARFPSNWELSSYRATTVARYLIARGVEQSRIQVSGHADTRPRVPNDGPQNRARNRRVSLLLQQWADASKQAPAMPGPGSWTAL